MAHSCPNKTKDPEKPHFPPWCLMNVAEELLASKWSAGETRGRGESRLGSWQPWRKAAQSGERAP